MRTTPKKIENSKVSSWVDSTKTWKSQNETNFFFLLFSFERKIPENSTPIFTCVYRLCKAKTVAATKQQKKTILDFPIFSLAAETRVILWKRNLRKTPFWCWKLVKNSRMWVFVSAEAKSDSRIEQVDLAKNLCCLLPLKWAWMWMCRLEGDQLDFHCITSWLNALEDEEERHEGGRRRNERLETFNFNFRHASRVYSPFSSLFFKFLSDIVCTFTNIFHLPATCSLFTFDFDFFKLNCRIFFSSVNSKFRQIEFQQLFSSEIKHDWRGENVDFPSFFVHKNMNLIFTEILILHSVLFWYLLKKELLKWKFLLWNIIEFTAQHQFKVWPETSGNCLLSTSAFVALTQLDVACV